MPFDVLTMGMLYRRKPIKQVEFENLLFTLKNEVIPVNPYL